VVVFLIYPVAKYPLISSRLPATDEKVYRTACSTNERLHILRRLSSIPSLLVEQTVPVNLPRCTTFNYKSKAFGEGPVL